VAGEILGVAVDDVVRALGGILLLERADEEGRADGGVADDRETSGVRGSADAGDVKEYAVRVARALEINVDLAAGLGRSAYCFFTPARALVKSPAVKPSKNTTPTSRFERLPNQSWRSW
jgi:hypothetical protein